ncbi:hypothetical protein [Methanonatronarchaeum sp. AMET6-2]|uniref:hypothetical protein n=1 Tax=Methanonatronarchaeum sp. AMET6-2 TaxID=2933293 RepID=UPI0012225F0C|nr:hypothetical protein [Methanonatronarchaeum sp. AMET6-2]RZN62998.1 MAG: hypothetical protein EF811_01380 [Methanonatronarchaeia archaeon]UOY09983.1 hypothetical protein MU439_06915 [Methanonatronarchaeum sp. AMET6-2]
MNRYINNMFSIGVLVAGIGSTGYQTLNNIIGYGEPWTLIPGVIVILLALTTIKIQRLGPALAGYTLIIPITLVSLVGLMMPLDQAISWAIPLYFLMALTMIIGITYSTYIGIKAFSQIAR